MPVDFGLWVTDHSTSVIALGGGLVALAIVVVGISLCCAASRKPVPSEAAGPEGPGKVPCHSDIPGHQVNLGMQPAADGLAAGRSSPGGVGLMSRWRPLELCYWPDQGALPAKGKEYPGLGYKRLRDKPPKAQEQEQQPAEAQ
ncbi:hypothetical protein HaLaN_26911, partial [Haematococcus lacustris]